MKKQQRRTGQIPALVLFLLGALSGLFVLIRQNNPVFLISIACSVYGVGRELNWIRQDRMTRETMENSQPEKFR